MPELTYLSIVDNSCNSDIKSDGITLLMRITRTMQLALEDLRSERLELVGSGVSFQEYMRIVDLDRWSAIEIRSDVDKAAGTPRGGGT